MLYIYLIVCVYDDYNHKPIIFIVYLVVSSKFA